MELSHKKWQLKLTALWHVTQCSLVGTDSRFRGAYCFHQSDDHKQDDGSSKRL